MSEIPAELKYTKDHEWVREQDDGSVILGITDHAQVSLGDLVFVELPEANAALNAGDACAVVESVKAASDVCLPLSGTIVEANEALADSPELVNTDPYGEGWLFRFKPDTPAQLEELLASEDYERFVAEIHD
jgi:glycine cleavage system H protein